MTIIITMPVHSTVFKSHTMVGGHCIIRARVPLLHTNLAYLVVYQAGCHLTHCLLPCPSWPKEDGVGGGQVLQGQEWGRTTQGGVHAMSSSQHSVQHITLTTVTLTYSILKLHT